MKDSSRLELNWIGKNNRPRLEPRIIIEDPSKSYFVRRFQSDLFDNKLIHGDNLLALKALEAEYSGKVKCIYIDPPFNTKQAFENYDDGLEHSAWLSLMRDRIEHLSRLLSDDGTFFAHIDDNEIAYLIVLMDEVFGRANRISVVTFKQGSATGHKSINPGVVSTSNFVLIYAKDKSKWKPNRLFTARGERDKRYGQFIINSEDPYNQWKFSTLAAAFARAHNLPEKGAKKVLGEEYESLLSEFVHENARAVVRLARPDYNNVSAAARALIDKSKQNLGTILKLERDGLSDIYLTGGERILFYTDKLKFIDGQYVAGEPLTSIWDDILSNNIHNEGGVDFPKGKKPEALIRRCIELSTKAGDLVLDSFAGSGTTGAVAHKMGRRWIMLELGAHAETHILPRMRMVIDGMDQSGVTEATNWRGGGGLQYYRLAPSLLSIDRYGQLVISSKYNPEMLSEAVCKLLGFTYCPSQEVTDYWKQGYSSESDFIFVTTRSVTYEGLAKLSEEVGEGRTLLVACRAYAAKDDAFSNITLKKIPLAVLAKCEWGRDDYSLAVHADPEPEATIDDEPASVPVPFRKACSTKISAGGNSTPTLFDEDV